MPILPTFFKLPILLMPSMMVRENDRVDKELDNVNKCFAQISIFYSSGGIIISEPDTDTDGDQYIKCKMAEKLFLRKDGLAVVCKMIYVFLI